MFDLYLLVGFLWLNTVAVVLGVVYLTRRTENACSKSSESLQSLLSHYKAASETSSETHRRAIEAVGQHGLEALSALKEDFSLLLRHDGAMQAGQSRVLLDSLNSLVQSNGHFNLKLLQMFLATATHGGEHPTVEQLSAIMDQIASSRIDLGQDNGRPDHSQSLREETIPPTRMP